MIKRKASMSLLLGVVFSVVMLQQTPADAGNVRGIADELAVAEQLKWLQTTLDTNFALYTQNNVVIGLEVFDLGGQLQYTLTEDDIILQAGSTTFFMGNPDTIWADFCAEVEAAQAGSGRLDLVVQDRNTGDIVTVRVYI